MRVITSILLLLPVVGFARKAPPQALAKADSLMRAGLAAGYYPGASLAVGDSRGVQFEACYGWQDSEHLAKVTPENVYDIASCTKIVATTLAVMKLYDEDRIDLEATVGNLLPQFASTAIARITVRELLMHTSGIGNIMLYSILFRNPDGMPVTSNTCNAAYPTPVDLHTYLSGTACADTSLVVFAPREGYRRAGECCYVNPAVDTLIENRIVAAYKPSGRGKYLYSDLNFHLLKLVVERRAGMSLPDFVTPLYARMGMDHTGYRPLEWTPSGNIIPTEDDRLMQRGLLRGYTHDEIGAVSDNAGGNAGVFSNAADLARFCRMMLGEGCLDGVRILSQRTVRLFTTATPRALGFDRRTGDTPLAGGYGHTGYTGTIMWIDPSKDLFMVFLSNRVNPSRTNRGLVDSSLRTRVWDAVAGACRHTESLRADPAIPGK